MTPTQSTIVACLRMNAETGPTRGIRENATEQLHAYLDRLAERRRYDRPSPFSRFVEKLETGGSSNSRFLD